VRIPVGKSASLEPGESEGIFRAVIPAAVNGAAAVAIARVGEQSFAFDSRCPHRAADLTIFGQIIGERRLRCGVHGHVYDLETGKCHDARDCDPRLETLAIFATLGDGVQVWVVVPEQEV
jgi:nitrite reductase/ring-hydroxylating ferredoxin subunit